MTLRAETRQGGSILLEHLLALALLSVLVISTLSLLMVGSTAAQMAQRASLGGELAAEKLEELSESCEAPTEVTRQPVDPGRFPGYHWQAATSEVASGLCQITVTVSWGPRGRERATTLTTLTRRQDDP